MSTKENSPKRSKHSPEVEKRINFTNQCQDSFDGEQAIRCESLQERIQERVGELCEVLTLCPEMLDVRGLKDTLFDFRPVEAEKKAGLSTASELSLYEYDCPIKDYYMHYCDTVASYVVACGEEMRPIFKQADELRKSQEKAKLKPGKEYFDFHCNLEEFFLDDEEEGEKDETDYSSDGEEEEE
jgi:hypothetical protein